MSPRREGNRLRPAVFLDRDGTINQEVHHLSSLKQLRLLPNSVKAIRRLNDLGYLVFIITNQAVVAHGVLSEAELAIIHRELIRRLKKGSAEVHEIFYCPHHPEAKLKKYRLVCECRKPSPGMIHYAAKKYSLNLRKSFLIGDMTADIALGNRVGISTVLVETGHAGKDNRHKIKPDYIAKNLPEAVKIISKNAQKN